MTDRIVFPSLPVERQSQGEALARPARVCIASYEFLGPSHNGGIGTAYFSLASALAGAGHEVTVLYLLGDRCENGTIDDWTAYFRDRGIEFVPLPVSPPMPDVPEAAAVSRDAYQWLRARDFDLIHFPELLGHGYYTELAKRQGLDFRDTAICVGTHSPMTWIREINGEAPFSPDEIEIDFLEHQSVRLADVVVGPSHYLLNWMRGKGWELPPRCYVQQYILSPDMQTYWEEPHRDEAAMRRVEEFVFFGRLEERKGLRVFCDALDRLSRASSAKFTVSFLGKSATVAGRDAAEYIKERGRDWPFDLRILTDRDQTGALRYLREKPGRVAIMPSLEDNLPNTVLECLCARIPFIAGGTGGIPEMIAAEDVERVTCAPTADELAGRLARALDEGMPLGRPAIDPGENRGQWVRWHVERTLERLAASGNEPAVSVEPAAPRVTVCLNWREFPEALPQTASALEAQDWPNFEVVLVDQTASGVTEADGDDESRQAGADLRQRFASRGWRITREPDTGGAAARDRAASQAAGDYLLFADERGTPKPDAISTFVRSAKHSKADILTCFLDLYSEKSYRPGRVEMGCHPFLGPAMIPGLFRNYLGEGQIFISKSAYQTIGGFAAGRGENCDYWEFLVRAVLAGFQLEVVPRALASFRLPDDLRPPTQALTYEDHLRNLRPYIESMPAALADLPKAALIMKLHYERQYHLVQVASGNEPPVLTDEQLLEMTQERLVARGFDRIAELMDAWTEYSAARANMPLETRDRIRHVLRQLKKGNYHRFAHGLGSALRDIRKPPRIRSMEADSDHKDTSSN